jgi:hypothetical protein
MYRNQKSTSAATPEEARAIYADMVAKHGKPSDRAVAKALTASGRPVSHKAIGRWRKKGWTREEDPSDPVLEMDAATPALTGDPMKRLDSLPPLDGDREAQWEVMFGEGLVAGTKIMRAIQAADDAVILGNPSGIAALYGKAFDVLLNAKPTVNEIKRGTDKVADVTPARPQLDPTIAAAIEGWKAPLVKDGRRRL